MDNHLIAIFQVFQQGKWALIAVGGEGVRGQNGVTNPGGISRAFEPADLICKPIQVPTGLILGNARYTGAHTESRDFHPQIAQVLVLIFHMLFGDTGDNAWRKTRLGQGGYARQYGEVENAVRPSIQWVRSQINHRGSSANEERVLTIREVSAIANGDRRPEWPGSAIITIADWSGRNLGIISCKPRLAGKRIDEGIHAGPKLVETLAAT